MRGKIRYCGGIGRHAGLRIRCRKKLIGSNPFSSTIRAGQLLLPRPFITAAYPMQKQVHICRNYSRIHTLKCAYVQSLYPRAKRSVTVVSGTNSRHTDTMTHTTCTVSTKNEE